MSWWRRLLGIKPPPRQGTAAYYNQWLKSLPEPTLEELTGRPTPSQKN